MKGEDCLEIKIDFIDYGRGIGYYVGTKEKSGIKQFHVTLNPTVIILLSLKYDMDIKQFFSEVLAHELIHVISDFFNIYMSEEDIREITKDKDKYKHTKKYFNEIVTDKEHKIFANNFCKCFDYIKKNSGEKE